MADGVNVRLSGPLRRFIDHRVGPNGLYENASEYIRDLIRHDYEAEEARRRAWLSDQLRAGAEADEKDFVPFDAQSILSKAKSRKTSKD